MEAEKIHRMDIKTRCPHCKGSGFVTHEEGKPAKPLDSDALGLLLIVVALMAFFGTMGFGGNFFLAVFFAMLFGTSSVFLVMWGERRLGIRK